MGKFIPNEHTKVVFVPALTGTISAPKVADITGGTDLTDLITGLTAGSQGNAVPTPSFGSRFETSIDGTASANFSVDFYREDASALDDAWDTLPRGTKGFFIISRLRANPVAGSEVEVWPVSVLSRSHSQMSNNTAVTFTVTCSVPVEPDEDAVVVA